MEEFLRRSTALFKRPLLVAAAGAVVTVVLASALPRLRFDNNIMNMLPETDPARETHERYEDIFGKSDMIFVGVESSRGVYTEEYVRYIDRLTRKIEELNGTLPGEALGRYLGLPVSEARQVIDVISEQGVVDPGELEDLFADPMRLSGEFFIDESAAGRIASRMADADPGRVMGLYRLPVSDVTSIVNADFIRGDGDRFIVEELLPGGEASPAAVSALRERVASWSLYPGALVADNGLLSTILVELGTGDPGLKSDIYRALVRLTEEERPRDLRIYIDGEPVIDHLIADYMAQDMRRLMPIVFAVIVVMLYLSFRNLRGVFYPLLAVGVSSLWTLGLMAWCGVPMNVVSTTIPVLLVAVGSAYGIHFMNHYFLDTADDRLTAVRRTVTGVGAAVSMAGLTTVAGFGSLATTRLVPVRNFGVFTAAGVFFALAATLYLVPSVLLLGRGPKTRPHFRSPDGAERHDRVSRLLHAVGRGVYRRHSVVVAVALLLGVVFALGISRIKVEMNNITFFKRSEAVRVADDRLNELLAGTQVLNFVLETKDGSRVIRPEILGRVDRFGRDVRREFPDVRKTVAVTDYLKKMNQEMYGGDPSRYRLPETERKTSDYLLLYSGKTDNVITARRDKLRMTLTIKRTSTAEIDRIKSYAHTYFDREFLDTHGLVMRVTGAANLYSVANRLIVSGQIASLAASLAVILLINALSFRSVRAALLSLVPVMVALVINFGLMGYCGIPLNAGTAMVAAIAIGIGIDYGIHFLVRYRAGIRSGGTVARALEDTIAGTGRSIVYNFVVVMAGFLVLMFSKFTPLIEFGALVALNMVLTGAAALVLIPSIIVCFKKEALS